MTTLGLRVLFLVVLFVETRSVGTYRRCNDLVSTFRVAPDSQVGQMIYPAGNASSEHENLSSPFRKLGLVSIK